MPVRFTEEETESFYDSHDSRYRAFWDEEGSLHWGVFDETTGDDFLKACRNLDNIMVRHGKINETASVIDLGCGNGNTSMWLAQSTGCNVLGVDLSGVRIKNANAAVRNLPGDVQKLVKFQKASVTDLPFDDKTFTNAWSQATIYHVPEKTRALKEAFRVLKNGGTFVFDDLIKPKPKVSESARKYVYDRLLFDTDFSFNGYKQTLEDTGFVLVNAIDLSGHLKTSYTQLAELALQVDSDNKQDYVELAEAYTQMVKCIERSEVGWAMYVCQKP